MVKLISVIPKVFYTEIEWEDADLIELHSLIEDQMTRIDKILEADRNNINSENGYLIKQYQRLKDLLLMFEDIRKGSKILES